MRVLVELQDDYALLVVDEEGEVGAVASALCGIGGDYLLVPSNPRERKLVLVGPRLQLSSHADLRAAGAACRRWFACLAEIADYIDIRRACRHGT